VGDDGRIFFQKRSAQRKLFPNTWDIVGGHLEPGETVAEALRREVLEETGWRIFAVLGVVGDFIFTGNDGVERHETDFLVRVDGDLERPRLEAGKHTEFRWLGRDELDVLSASGDPNDAVIRRIAEDGFAVLHTLGL
jgi:8-oxo-dGTP diphosphatase